MDVGRDLARRIGQDDIGADFGVRRFWVEHDALLHQFRAVLESGKLVVKALICKLCIQECHLLFSCFLARTDVTAV